MSVVALVCAALATLLAMPARPRSATAGGKVTPARLRTRALVALAVAAGGVAAGASADVVALGAVSGAAVLAAHLLWRRRRSRHEALLTSARVLETCEQLAGELAAGQPPGLALDRAAQTWEPLAPVAEAFRVGSDVSQAFRVLAERPGAGDLRLVGATWQVAHRTGQGLAESVDRVALGLRQAHATRRIVRGELASARSTARLVAGLPVLVLTMGSGAGGDPWSFLFGEPAGLACLAGGLAFGLAGLTWMEAIARDVDAGG